MEIRLTIKSVIRWEQLTGRSFSQIDYSDNEDITSLLYCSALSCNTEMPYTLDVFRQTTVNDKLMKQMTQALSRESIVMAQFCSNSTEAPTDRNEGESGKVSDIVSTLIMAGLDAGFALNEMKLCDLPMFIKAYEQKKKEQLENSRLWAYLGILPHVDGKKLPSAMDLYPFPWELEQIEQNAAEAIQVDSERFDTFMNEGKNLINDNYGR